MFERILIANRGEIARRVMRACQSLGVKTVLVVSEADEDAPYTSDADEVLSIGPGPAAPSYLNQDAILDAAERTQCQAIHPGYGFLSENALFATRCEQQKLTFIGPKPRHIRMMGDKATARKTMQEVGIPVLPGSKTILSSFEQAQHLAKEIGYPVLLKATAGGGGKGMRLVSHAEELKSMFEQAQNEAEKAFGNADLYLEKFVVGARHIEFQILADAYGHMVHLGERECSIQRNHQKLLEEAPAWGMTDALRKQTGDNICAALGQIGYQGLGTLEFLMDADQQLYFMEMNTRLQVEHPVTEAITGLDLVAWQIRVAAGEHLTLNQEDIHFSGHAIECRINAEDPADNFRPSPGTLKKWLAPKDVRVDTHVQEGYTIPSYYDSLIAKLIVHGSTREDAIQILTRALNEFAIEGLPTTLSLHRKIAQDPLFLRGGYTCNFLMDSGLWQKSS